MLLLAVVVFLVANVVVIIIVERLDFITPFGLGQGTSFVVGKIQTRRRRRRLLFVSPTNQSDISDQTGPPLHLNAPVAPELFCNHLEMLGPARGTSPTTCLAWHLLGETSLSGWRPERPEMLLLFYEDLHNVACLSLLAPMQIQIKVTIIIIIIIVIDDWRRWQIWRPNWPPRTFV